MVTDNSVARDQEGQPIAVGATVAFVRPGAPGIIFQGKVEDVRKYYPYGDGHFEWRIEVRVHRAKNPPLTTVPVLYPERNVLVIVH